MPTSTRGAIDLPFNEAIDFFRQKVNVPTERWTDMMNEAHSHGFAVAGATNEAMLSDFREAVDKAISQGTGLAEFRADFDTIVKIRLAAHRQCGLAGAGDLRDQYDHRVLGRALCAADGPRDVGRLPLLAIQPHALRQPAADAPGLGRHGAARR